MAVGEWVAVGEQLCLAIYGSERHVTKRKKKKVYCSDETGWKLHNGLDYIPAQSPHFVLASSSNMFRG